MGSERQRRFLQICVFILLPSSALADRVFWACGYGDPQVHRSGPIACRQEVRQCGTMILSCSRGSEALFVVNDFADHIAASGDGRYVVGLSNRGSENAFWIRDASGKILHRKTHSPEFPGGLHYCRISISNVREWFDAKNPNVRFQVKDGELVQVTVRGCDGRDLQLLR